MGVGKSFVASCFKKLGAAVFDADSVVHQLYKLDKGIISYAEKNFPGVVIDGEIDRSVLSKYFLAYDKNWIKFQSLIHAAVLCKLELFIECEKKINRKFLVLDLPLLLETNIHLYCDLIIFVDADSAVQNQRLSKRNIGKEKLNLISKIQLPVEVKRKLSDYIINTDVSEEQVFSQVKKIVDSLT